ncbi:MAG: glycosyltransferase family 39 protein [bacterium]|nr:glycosyltransferase family 39 protein [bacterium]
MNIIWSLGKRPRDSFLLGFILVFAFWLRVRGLDLLIPYFINPDELRIVNSALAIIKTGDWNPHNFKYGAFLIYVTTIIYWFYFHFSAFFHGGGWHSAFETSRSFLPWGNEYALFYLGRLFCVFAGVFLSYLSFLVGKRLFNQRVGLLAAFFVAIVPLAVERSQIFNVDIFSALGSLAALYFSIGIMEKKEARFKDYLWAGLSAGIALAAKYNFLAFLPVLGAHLLGFFPAEGKRGYKWIGRALFSPKLWLAAYVALLVFFLFNPFVFFDWPAFVREMLPFFQQRQVPHFSYFHSLIYQRYIFQIFLLFPAIYTPFLFLAAAGGAWEIGKEAKGKLLLLFIFPLGYFVFAGGIMLYAFHQHYFPLLPFVALSGAYFFVSGWERQADWKKIFKGLLCGFLVIFCLSDIVYPQIQPLYTIHNDLGRWLKAEVRENEKAILTGWFFTPDPTFWQGQFQRVAQSSNFNDDLIRSGGYDYIVVLAAETLEKDAGFFHSQEGWETSEKLRGGKFDYRLAETINFSPWWRKAAGLVFPLIRGYRFEIYRKMK